MKTKTYINNMVKAIGNKEIKDNFKQRLMPQFEAYFPGAIEGVEDDLEVYVSDLLLYILYSLIALHLPSFQLSFLFLFFFSLEFQQTFLPRKLLFQPVLFC